jgi:hypothetical protein
VQSIVTNERRSHDTSNRASLAAQFTHQPWHSGAAPTYGYAAGLPNRIASACPPIGRAGIDVV